MKRIELLAVTKSINLIGSAPGQFTFSTLRKLVEKERAAEISLLGIMDMDATFARESIVMIAKLFRAEKAILLSDATSRDVLDNIDYAARALNQCMMVQKSRTCHLIGREIGRAHRDVLTFAMARNRITTAEVAAEFALSVQNASQRLSRLHNLGLLIREQDTAVSGGYEYIYESVGASPR